MDSKQLTTQNYIVYVLRDGRCPGSTRLLEQIDPYREDFAIVDVGSVRDPPEWLNGTPILADVSGDDGIIYRGTAALQHAQRLYADDDAGSEGLKAMSAPTRGLPLG